MKSKETKVKDIREGIAPGIHVFFLHIRKYCHAMTQLLEHGQPASLIMEAVKGPLIIKTG